MMKKAGIFTAIAVLAAVFTAGCGQAKLPESFSEEEVKKEAEKSIALFNERDYAGLIEMGSEELKAGITEEQFAEAGNPYLDKCGEFEEITKTVFAGGHDKNSGIDYATAVMIGEYENGKIQFTVSFDEDMEMIQFLIK